MGLALHMGGGVHGILFLFLIDSFSVCNNGGSDRRRINTLLTSFLFSSFFLSFRVVVGGVE